MFKHYKRIIILPFVYLFGNRVGASILNFILKITYYLLGYGSGDNTLFSGEISIINHLKKSKKGEKLQIFDVGANIGQFTKLVSKKIHNADFDIYCFEPMQKSFKILSEKYKDFQNYKLFNFALGSSIGEKKIFFDNLISGSASLVKFSHHYDVEKSYNAVIQVDTVDNFIEKKNIKKIDLLKVDVEGYEMDVFLGAKKSIIENKINSILFEFGGNGISQRVLFYDIFNFFKKNNYNLFRLMPSGHLVEIKEYNSSQEVIYCTNYFAEKKQS